MFSSLILGRVVTGVPIGTAAMLLLLVNLSAAEATPLRDNDASAVAQHVAPPAAPIEPNDPSLLDTMPVQSSGAAQTADSGLTGGVSQQDFLGRANAPQAAINRDPFKGLTSLGLDEGNGVTRLQDLRDILHSPTNATASKEFSFDSTPGTRDPRRGVNSSGLPGISELVFGSSATSGAIRSVVDIKTVGAHAVDFSILGIGDFMIEKLPDSRGVVIREGTTGVEVGLHHSTQADGDGGIAAARSDDGEEQISEEKNLTRLIFNWVVERLSSPLGILGCMFVVVVFLLWGLANSIVMLRRRVRRQSNA